MPRRTLSRFEPGRLTMEACIPCKLMLQRVPLNRESNLLSLIMASAFLFVWGFCMVTPALAQNFAEVLSSIPGGTPPINATGRAIGTLCPPLAGERARIGSGAFTATQNDLIDRCTEMVVNGGQQSTLNPLLQASPYKTPSQGTGQVDSARVQSANIGARLAALRGGAMGISIRGLSFNPNGKTLPGTMLASLLPDNEDRQATTADAPTFFPKFEASTSPKTAPGVVLADLLAQSKNDGMGSSGKPSAFDKLGVFANGNFSLGDRDKTSREAGFDFHTLGTTAGIDYRFTNNFILGGAFGYASTDADLDTSGGSLDTNQYSGSIYGTYYFERLYVDGIVTIGWNTFDSKRNIFYTLPAVPPSEGTTQVNQTANGDTDGTNYSLGIGGGYEFRSGGFAFVPYGRLNYFKLDINGYRESINNADPGFGLALEFRDQTIESLTTALGGQVIYAYSTHVAVLVPQLLFEWVHEFLNDGRLIAGNYVNDPSKQPLNIRTDGPGEDFFNLGLGLSAVFQGGKSAFIYYQTALALAHTAQNEIILGVRLAF
jgi:outer membrane autotransporter protein